MVGAALKPSESARRASLDRARELGLEPYAKAVGAPTPVAEIVAKYGALLPGESLDDEVLISGRVVAIRNSGLFLDVNEPTGKIQVYHPHHKTCEVACVVDVGDLVSISGTMRRTRRGELTVSVVSINLLTKTLRSLPEKFHGLVDVEARLRYRHVDILANPDSADRFRKRVRIVSRIRKTMEANGFAEVETPMLHPVYGGATARPFETQHNSLDMRMYLRIAPELYLKRVMVSGLYTKVFEINRNFRNEGLSTRHNPEFTMMEAYSAFSDYTDMMSLAETVFAEAADAVELPHRVSWGGKTFSVDKNFGRISMPAAVYDRTGLDFLSCSSAEEAHKMVLSAEIEADAALNWGELLLHVFEGYVEKFIIDPTHVTDYPKDVSPFAREVAGEPRLVERFETFVAGVEVCNAFSELTDPMEQRARLLDQIERTGLQGEVDPVLDEDFLEAMEFGLPPCGGLGMGIDRLVMMLTGAESIKDVILFPAMRRVASR